MCNLYASADPFLYESQTRSIRLQGAVTSVRLENEFWTILEEIAAGEGYGVPQFINQLYSEVLLRGNQVNNLASMLRVHPLPDAPASTGQYPGTGSAGRERQASHRSVCRGGLSGRDSRA
ncbi:ribbon-helix-helix domain-containing protein [Stutzerimonas nitrititolerans]|uniref:ribbon-helix-helix domain-containing protein n=1 Tax=Stutzerimonas nitrititolerans TaxID=2482751 RepID=UPI0035E42D40